MPVPLCPNQRRSLDFLSNTCGACRTFRNLAVDGDCCRGNLCLVPDTGIFGARVAPALDALVRICGNPACLGSDNGTEFTSKAILKWANDNAVAWHFIDPRKPQKNGYIESFNRSLRDECLNADIFQSPADARGPSGTMMTTTSGRIHRTATRPPSDAHGALERRGGTAPGALATPESDDCQTPGSS